MAEFLVMKAHALAKRDKSKDAYDLCFILEERRDEVAENWRARIAEGDVAEALIFLRQKFGSPEDYGPQQLVSFHNDADPLQRAITARRAYELLQAFLTSIDSPDTRL